jgi:hypothetical protein
MTPTKKLFLSLLSSRRARSRQLSPDRQIADTQLWKKQSSTSPSSGGVAKRQAVRDLRSLRGVDFTILRSPKPG